MIEIQNNELWTLAIANALGKIGTSGLTDWETIRHTNALAKAAARIESNGDFMTYDADKKEMLILSPVSNAIYEANGTCQCESFERGNICWHRTAARLWTRYLELVKAADDAALELAAKLSEFAARLNEMPKLADVRTPPPTHRANGGVDIPYLRNTVKKPVERIGNIRI